MIYIYSGPMSSRLRKPLALRLRLSDVELRRRVSASLRDSMASERSSASGLSSASGGVEPPVLRLVGGAELLMDLSEATDAELAELRSPRLYLEVAGGRDERDEQPHVRATLKGNRCIIV